MACARSPRFFPLQTPAPFCCWPLAGNPGPGPAETFAYFLLFLIYHRRSICFPLFDKNSSRGKEREGRGARIPKIVNILVFLFDLKQP